MEQLRDLRIRGASGDVILQLWMGIRQGLLLQLECSGSVSQGLELAVVFLRCCYGLRVVGIVDVDRRC